MGNEPYLSGDNQPQVEDVLKGTGDNNIKVRP